MRILLYIEPYPLRNEMDHLRDVAIGFANMLIAGGEDPDFQEHDIRLFSNHDVLNRVQESSFASKRFLLWPEREEMDLFRSGLTDWTTGGIAGWRDLLRGEGDVTSAYFSVLDALRERFPFDLIVHWGENGAVRLFAEAHGIGRVVITPGCLRKPLMDSFIIDAGGSGAGGLLASTPIKAVIEAAEDKAWPPSADQFALAGPEPIELAETLYGTVNFSGCEHILNRGDGRAAYVPLHPHDDPDFLAHSGFSTPAEFLREIVVPLAQKRLVVAVRPERACWETEGGDAAMAEARAAITGLPERVLWLDPRTEPVSALQLLNLTDGVITANGHFAFQAMLFERPVSIIGDAYYKPEGVFFKPEDIVRGRVHRKAYPEAIRALRTFILRAGLVSREDVFSFPVFMQRVLSAAGNMERHSVTPAQVLRELIETFGPDEPEALLKEQLPPPPPISEEPVPRTDEQPATVGDETATAKPKRRSLIGNLFGRVRRQRSGAPGGPSSGPYAGAVALDPSPDEVGAPRRFPLSEQEIETIDLAREVLRTQTRRKRKLAVILHCYYRDTTVYLLDQLSRISGSYDLICTIPDFSAGIMESEILHRKPAAIVVPLPNRGEHIWPFSFILNELGPDKYDTILKLHTKKHYAASEEHGTILGHAWLEYALACLLGTHESKLHVGEILKHRPDWSLAGPSGLLARPSCDPAEAESMLREAGLRAPEEWTTFAGGMFWADPQIFAPLIPDLSEPERYAPPRMHFPHEFSCIAETLLTAAGTTGECAIAGLLPDIAEPEINPPPIPGSIEDVLLSYATWSDTFQ
ncbi:MAG: rhamnan synthesis F family protein [Pseudomonadota bacterium]